MPLIIPQGCGYGIAPRDGKDYGPHTIMVRLAARDFYNPVSFAPVPNPIANPDGFPLNKPTSSGGAAANETGYLGALAQIDLSQAMRQQGMSWLASVYIDNSQGAGTVLLRNRASGLSVTAAPFTQGHYPLLLPKGSVFNFDVAYIDSSSDNISTQPSFATYPDITADKSGGGGVFYGAVVESGFLRLQFTDVVVPPSVWTTRNWQTGIWYNFPTTIAVGGTYQLALGKNPFRKGFLIGNATAAVEVLNMALHQDFETDATASSIGIAPGQYYQQLGPPVYTGVVNIVAATGGHVVIVKEFQ
jgi:hypothetical protein